MKPGPLTRAIDAFRAGRMVVILDGPERENEGDLAMAAEFVTPPAIAFMAVHARGLICVPMPGSRLDCLGVHRMAPCSKDDVAAFTVSVDAREGTTSGISAHDRARTIRALLDPATRPEDLVRPGHVFPLRYNKGGVLARAGHTEASVDLARLGGLYPAAVICEVMKRDGSMARLQDLRVFGRRHGVPLVSVEEVAEGVRARLTGAQTPLMPAGAPSH